MSETGSGAGSESGSGAGEHVASVTESEIVTVVTVAMAVALSFSLNVLERGIKRFKYSTVMLKMIFRETMIVGIVSAFMYGLERTDNQIEHDQELFEEVHMTMYSLAIIYALMCLMLVGLALRGSGRARIERMSIQEWRHHASMVRSHHTLHKEAEDRGIVAAWRDSLLWGCCATSPAVVLHHEVRALFILTRGLPSSFHFLTYLKKCEQHVFFSLSEIRGRLWAAFAWFVILDLEFRDTFTAYDERFQNRSASIVVVFILLVVCAVALYVKVQRMLHLVLSCKHVALVPSIVRNAKTWHELISQHREYQPRSYWESFPSLLDPPQVQGMFWFNAPVDWLVVLVQAVVFVAAFTAAFALRILGDREINDGVVALMWIVFLGCFLIVAGFCRLVVPLYAILQYVGVGHDDNLLAKAIAKQRLREETARALAEQQRRRDAQKLRVARTASQRRLGEGSSRSLDATVRRSGAAAGASERGRQGVGGLAEHWLSVPWVKNVLYTAVLSDFFMIAVMTHPPTDKDLREVLYGLDVVCVMVFAAEIVLKFLAARDRVSCDDRDVQMLWGHILLVVVIVILACFRSKNLAGSEASDVLYFFLRLTRIIHAARLLTITPELEEEEEEAEAQLEADRGHNGSSRSSRGGQGRPAQPPTPPPVPRRHSSGTGKAVKMVRHGSSRGRMARAALALAALNSRGGSGSSSSRRTPRSSSNRSRSDSSRARRRFRDAAVKVTANPFLTSPASRQRGTSGRRTQGSPSNVV